MEFAEMLDTSAGAGTRAGCQELVLVAGGSKPGCRIKVARDTLPKWIDKIEDLGLSYAVGSICIMGSPVAGRQGYSEWPTITQLTPYTRSASYLYAAPSAERADRLRMLEEGAMTEQLGEALGYPPCCIAAFAERARYGSDPVIDRYNDESVIAWLLNVSLSCFGWTCLSHFPCSETCNASFELARSHFEAIYLCNDAYARTLAARLGTTVIHSRALGVASTHARDTGGLLACRAVTLADPDSPLAVALQPGVELEYLASGARRIGSLTLPKEDARIFRFH